MIGLMAGVEGIAHCFGMIGDSGFEKRAYGGALVPIRVSIEGDGSVILRSCKSLDSDTFCRMNGGNSRRLSCPRCMYFLQDVGTLWEDGGLWVKKVTGVETLESVTGGVRFGFVVGSDGKRRPIMQYVGDDDRAGVFLKNVPISKLSEEVQKLSESGGRFALGPSVYEKGGEVFFGPMMNCDQVGVYDFTRNSEDRRGKLTK